jgi:UDP-glucose 4-epimerase
VKALITGGAGFIGSNLADALIERGDDVIVVDNLSSGKHENLAGAIERGARLVVEDVRDRKIVGSLLAAEKPQVVFHLAAQIDVRVSVAKPDFDAEVNVLGTVNMLDAAREAGAERFLFASTGGALYGEGGDPPYAEDSPINPEAPYGQSKLAAEGYCGLAHRLHGLSTVCLRFGNVFGPRQDPHGEAGVIAIFCGRMAAGERPLIFGDGSQTRDYVYVEDVVNAFQLAAGRSETGSYNVGCGIETSVLELTTALAALGAEAGLAGAANFEPEFAAARPGEVQRSALDPAKAAAVLGFEAKLPLEEGLRRTLASVA